MISLWQLEYTIWYIIVFVLSELLALLILMYSQFPALGERVVSVDLLLLELWKERSGRGVSFRYLT